MVKVGTEGLYLKPSSGTYYARYRLHGAQRWKSLKTKVLTQAKVRLREKMTEIEKARSLAAPSAGLLTLGDCDRLLREQLARIFHAGVAEVKKTATGRRIFPVSGDSGGAGLTE